MDLVDENVVPAFPLDLRSDVIAKRDRVFQRGELPHVKRHFDDLRGLHAVFQQIVAKEIEQEKTLPATADAGYDFHETIVSPLDQAIQVSVSLDSHISSLF